MERDLTTGSVFKTVIYFSLPYLLSYFLQTLYGMADLFIVGQFGGVSSTTAVSIGSQIMHMLTVMIVGLAMGATVMIGRCIGAKDYKKASETIGNTATMFMGIAIILMIVLLADSQTDCQCDVDTGRGSRRNDPLSDNLLYRDSFLLQLIILSVQSSVESVIPKVRCTLLQ